MGRRSGIYASIPQGLMRSKAFQKLKPTSQIAIVWLELIYWEGERKNPMEISQKNLADWVNLSPKTAQNVLTELDDYGFLCRERAGSLKGPHSSRTAIYRMTWRYDNSGEPPTRDYKSYKL